MHSDLLEFNMQTPSKNIQNAPKLPSAAFYGIAEGWQLGQVFVLGNALKTTQGAAENES